ncbi:MAG: hypothetical protein LUB61_03785, partial [Eggerthellaceae bacterium]|nr:hypothetical protein [Eggerthellaceae bacterium]
MKLDEKLSPENDTEPKTDGTIPEPSPENEEETGSSRGQRLKKAALDKTPKKLKNPTELQVRFRTGLVYTFVTIVCVLCGTIPM